MKTEKRNYDRFLTIISLVISFGTLLLTSPILQDFYISPNLVMTAMGQSNNTVMLEIKNNGHKKATGVVIELADISKDLKEVGIQINNILFIPPKEFSLVQQGPYKLIKINDPILPGEDTRVWIGTDLKEKAWPYLWLRVRSDAKDYGHVRMKNL